MNFVDHGLIRDIRSLYSQEQTILGSIRKPKKVVSVVRLTDGETPRKCKNHPSRPAAYWEYLRDAKGGRDMGSRKPVCTDCAKAS